MSIANKIKFISMPLLIGGLLLWIFSPAILPFLYALYIDPVTNIDPVNCSSFRPNEKYCVERYQDDGLVRWSSLKSDLHKNCCIFERYNIHDELLSYRLLTCSKNKSIELDCSRYQGRNSIGEGFVIDGQETFIDGTWPDHTSIYLNHTNIYE